MFEALLPIAMLKYGGKFTLREAWVDGGLADMFCIDKNYFTTEIEIKTSLADWNADRKKGKFDYPRPHVHRFYFAVPESLVDKKPTWVPRSCGLISVYTEYDGTLRLDRAKIVKKSIRPRGSEPVPYKFMERVFGHTNRRHWDLVMKINARG